MTMHGKSAHYIMSQALSALQNESTWLYIYIYIYNAYGLLKLRVEGNKYFCHMTVYRTTTQNLQMQPFAHLLRFQAILCLFWGCPLWGPIRFTAGQFISVSKRLSGILTCASKCVSTVCVVLWPPSSAISRYLRSCQKKTGIIYTKINFKQFSFFEVTSRQKKVTIQTIHFAFYSYI